MVRIVKSQQDLDLLKQTRAMPLDVVYFIQEEFHRLYQAYGEANGLPIDRFHTDAHHCGYIVFLEDGDNPDDLSVIGLSGGFRQTIVEFVERRHTGQRPLYRLVVLFDNEFGLTILFEPGLNDNQQLEAWLDDEAGGIPYLPPTGTTGEAAWEVPF